MTSYPPPPPPPGSYPPPGGMSMGGSADAVAEVGPRLIAGLVDLAAPVVVYWVLSLVVAAADLGAVIFLLWLALIAFYLWNTGYQQGVTGQSIGKKMQGIKLVKEDTGQVLGAGLGIGRAFLHILDQVCLIGYIVGLVTPKRQTFADMILKTVAVKA